MIEVVVYVAILSVIMMIIVVGLLQMSKVWARSRNERKVAAAGEVLMERITRELRLGISVADADITATSIQFNTYNSYQDLSGTTNKGFALAGGQVTFNDGASSYIISPNDVAVNNLNFVKLISSTESKTARTRAIRIAITLSSGLGVSAVSHTFYNTVILRSQYY